MKLIFSFGEITTKTSDAFKRFPVTIAWAIVGTLIAFFTIEIESEKIAFMKLIFTFVLGVSWLIATRFFVEQFESDREWIVLFTITFLGLFYWHLPNDGNELGLTYIIRFILYFIAGHLLVIVAPFILKWEKSAYFNYLKHVFIAILRSLFFSLILFLGIVLALLAIKHLFNVDFHEKRFIQIYVICIGTVNTLIYLSNFPKNIYVITSVDYTKTLGVLIKYILIPLVILYLIILYAYSLKIVMNWNLPKGWVSYLVVALSFLGFSIQILISPIQKTTPSRSIKQFYPWFYLLLLPLIVLLFVAIFRRISEYGVTENRYFVLALAFWILAMTLYMLFSKKKKIRIFSLSLSIVTILISFGFWGVFSVSTKSQVTQFKKVFNQLEMQNFTTSYQMRNQLQSIVTYLYEKEEVHLLTNVLGYNPKEVFKNEKSWNIPFKIVDSLNIKVDNTVENSIDKNNFKQYHLNMFTHSFITKEYDYFKQLNLEDPHKKNAEIERYSFFLSSKSNLVTIINKERKETEIINLENFIKTLTLNNLSGLINDKDMLTIEKQFKYFNVKIVFKNLNLRKKNDKENRLVRAQTLVFIKEKNGRNN